MKKHIKMNVLVLGSGGREHAFVGKYLRASTAIIFLLCQGIQARQNLQQI